MPGFAQNPFSYEISGLAARRTTAGKPRLMFALYVRNDNRAAKLVKLIATCGPLDLDDPQPAITVMLPDED